MGRGLLEIKRFRGIVGNADPRDMDSETASMSVNVDPVAPEGVLRGMRGLSSLHAETAPDGLSMLVGKAFTDSELGPSLIGVNSNHIQMVEDYLEDPSVETLGDTPGDTETEHISVEILRNRAYIGLGQQTPPLVLHKPMEGQTRWGTPLEQSGYQLSESGYQPPISVGMRATGFIGGSSITIFEREDGRSGIDDLPPSGVIFHTRSHYIYPIVYTGKSGNDLTGLIWPDGTPSNNPIIYSLPGEYHFTYNATYPIFPAENSPAEIQGNGFGFERTARGVSPSAPNYNHPLRLIDDTGSSLSSEGHYVLLASYVYERGYHSPLYPIRMGTWIVGTDSELQHKTYDHIATYLQAQIWDGIIPSRVTAINYWLAPYERASLYIYHNGYNFPRKDYLSGQQASARLVFTWNIEESYSNHSYDLVLNGTKRIHAITPPEIRYEGPTYEDVTGIPESAPSMSMYYRCSTTLNNEMFVGNVQNLGMANEDWSHYIIKSIPLDYESFDWINNHVFLPSPVQALESFAGRVYASDGSNLYRINPDYMVIEDAFPGMAPINASCLLATESGLFILNKDHLYMFDGREFHIVSLPIQENVDHSSYGLRYLLNEALQTDPVNNRHTIWLGFDEGNRLLLVRAGAGGCYVYNMLSQQWHFTALSFNAQPIMGHRGHLLTVHSDNVWSFYKGPRQPWSWASQRLTMGRDSQKKKFRKLDIDGDFTEVEFSIDGGSFGPLPSSGTTASNGTNLRFIIEGAGSHVVKSAGLLFRDKGGYPS